MLANDEDDNGDPLTAVLVQDAAHGALLLNADGSLSYTPDGDFSGTDTFTYKANDGSADSNIATVTITVNAVNDAPVAVGDSYSVNEDDLLAVGAPGVLGNDSDLDGDTLTAVLASGPAHGLLSLSADGSFSYSPNSEYSGPDSFTYKANDGSADSNVVTVDITVVAVNDDPLAADDSATMAEDSGATAINVLANDTDAENDVLTITSVTQPANGAVAITGGGTGLTYHPNADFNGVDTFTYTINDGNGGTAVGAVTVSVTAVNDAPVAGNNTYSMDENETLTIAAPGVLANDTDVDGDTLTAVLVDDVSSGTLTLNPDGSFTYEPELNFNGTVTFTYKANDGSADSDVATVTIHVSSVLGATDRTLYAKALAAKVSWALHAREVAGDKLVMRGAMNPRGANTDLTGAKVGLSINNVVVIREATLDSIGAFGGSVGDGAQARVRFSAKNGRYILILTGADLRSALGLENETGMGTVELDVRLRVEEAGLVTSVVRGTLEAVFVT